MSSAPDDGGLAELERALAEAGPPARAYLLPLGLVTGPAAEALAAEGRALPIAGGPLAATAGLVRLRGPDGAVREAAVPVAALERWVRSDRPVPAHVATLMERIAAPRPAGVAPPPRKGVLKVT
ncbi:MAG: hypothetical protein IRY94_12445, partial [Rhodospirillaceae bacterium]|nr:hypothetical protein [Rhodospirillaceae bacterium]